MLSISFLPSELNTPFRYSFEQLHLYCNARFSSQEIPPKIFCAASFASFVFSYSLINADNFSFAVSCQELSAPGNDCNAAQRYSPPLSSTFLQGFIADFIADCKLKARGDLLADREVFFEIFFEKFFGGLIFAAF